jgi:hypothetical protein
MKNFVDYTSRKCFASARVASPRLRNITHTPKISFSGLVIQITIIAVGSHGNYYFIDRFLIFNFSCLREPEAVRK